MYTTETATGHDVYAQGTQSVDKAIGSRSPPRGPDTRSPLAFRAGREGEKKTYLNPRQDIIGGKGAMPSMLMLLVVVLLLGLCWC